MDQGSKFISYGLRLAIDHCPSCTGLILFMSFVVFKLFPNFPNAAFNKWVHFKTYLCVLSMSYIVQIPCFAAALRGDTKETGLVGLVSL